VIHREFIAPNFTCKVRDNRGVEAAWVTYASSEDSLKKRLRRQGYQILNIRPYNFAEWQDRARCATDRAESEKKSGAQHEFDNTLWTFLKRHLFELFHGKCAYCEAKLQHVSSGDVEHYRPKKKVDEAPGHTGYWWLAYECTNLLPCCERCNRGRGKMNHFPVRGTHARSMEEVPNEVPLLLNPYEHNPEEHLRFISPLNGTSRNGGGVRGISEQGKKSVEVYNLRREYLTERRREAQNTFVEQLSLYVTLHRTREINRVIEDLRSGEREFSAACLAAFKSWIAAEEAELQRLRNSVDQQRDQAS
jgi:uncharacterized protein (TIGR02646 family)